MKTYHQQTLIFLIISFYLTLYIHDSNLYPHLSNIHTAILSFLRFILLALPIIFGFLIVKFKQAKFIKTLLIILWLLFLPYTIYSITEIRHVAELCRLPESGSYYTETCLANLWTLFPTFIYAAMGSLSFVFSVSQVTSHLFTASWKKQLTIILLCFSNSFASVFGLYTRINIWEILSNPVTTFQSLFTTIIQEGFLLNTLIFTSFVLGYFFIINRLMRQTPLYIK